MGKARLSESGDHGEKVTCNDRQELYGRQQVRRAVWETAEVEGKYTAAVLVTARTEAERSLNTCACTTIGVRWHGHTVGFGIDRIASS